jgi:hypothetical protein
MGLSSNKSISPPPAPNGKIRASYAIKAKPKRTISFEIKDIKTALTLALNPEQPNRTKLYEIYDYILEDSQLWFQIYLVALKKILVEPYALYSNGIIDEDATKSIKKKWNEKLIKHIFESEFFGFRMIEVIVSGEAIELELIPNQNVCPEYKIIWITDAWQKPNIPYDGLEDDLNLLFFGDKNDLGSLRRAAYNVIWKYYARSDWSRTSEKFGMPILSIEADTNNDSEIDRLEHRASTFGNDGYIVTQNGDKVNIIEKKSDNSHLIFFDNIKYCDEQSSKVSNGQTGTSDEKAFVGGAEVHERLLNEIIYSRMTNITYEWNDQVLPFLKKRNYIPATIDEFKFVNLETKKDSNKTEPTPEPPKPKTKK